MSTVSPDSVAQDQIKAFVERILRLKEEAKAINGDIREIYAEAKGNGFDKTVLGKVVNYVEKRAAGAADLAEAESLFDLYLTAYDGAVGTKVATHRHEAIEPQAQPVQTGAAPGTPTSNAGTEAVEAPAINQAETPTSFSSVETTSGIGSASDASAMLHPGVVDGPTTIALQAGTVVTAGETATQIPVPQHEAEEAGEDVVTAASSPDTHPEPETEPPGVSEAGDRGAVTPPAAATVVPFVATYAEPGVIVMERCPPEGIIAHPFAACWPVNSIDVTDGVREPIVKLGKFILDGRGRYFAARDAGIEYPVVQYDGADPLRDVIRWNLASRKLTENQRRLIAQKLAKAEPSRADDVMQLFELHREAAE